MLSTKAQNKIDSWKEFNVPVERDSWDKTFMGLAFKIAERSIDSRTHHGCVLVNDGTILSTGYNSFIRQIDDSVLPNSSQLKYPFMIHSEVNAIYNCARQGKSTMGAICYVTGWPCINCFQALYQAGIKEVVYGNRLAVMLDNDDAFTHIEILLHLMNGKMTMREFSL